MEPIFSPGRPIIKNEQHAKIESHKISGKDMCDEEKWSRVRGQGLGLFCCSFVFVFLLDGVVRKGLSEEVMTQQKHR